MATKPGESKKEEYRSYLEQSGVVDAMTKVLVTLYEEPEKPDNAIDFLKSNLGAPTPLDLQRVESEKEELQVQVDALKEVKVVSLSCGSYHTVCCTDEGHVYVWGKGANGALGMGPQVEMTHTPQRVLGNLKHEHVVQVSAGQLHTIAMTKSGQLFTWGRGAGGRLGHKGGAVDLWAPKAVEPLQWEKVVYCDAGVGHTAVVTATNACYVFGEGGGGRLGNGMQSPALLPIKIEDLDMGPENKPFDDAEGEGEGAGDA